MYLVIADFIFEVNYGVDNSSYLCGIFNVKEDAQKWIDNNQKRTDVFIDTHGVPVCAYSDYDGEYPARYSDAIFNVTEFNGSPVFVGGGAAYL